MMLEKAVRLEPATGELWSATLNGSVWRGGTKDDLKKAAFKAGLRWYARDEKGRIVEESCPIIIAY